MNIEYGGLLDGLIIGIVYINYSVVFVYNNKYSLL